MREKVATLIEMTQRSEEEVCCALYECDNHLERAVVFLLETLPVVSILNFFNIIIKTYAKITGWFRIFISMSNKDSLWNTKNLKKSFLHSN